MEQVKEKIESIIIIGIFYFILIGSVLLLTARFNEINNQDYSNNSSLYDIN